MKWTRYQLRVIAELRRGQRLHYINGMHAHYFIGHLKPRPTDATVQKLKLAGVIRLLRGDCLGETWIWNEEAMP